MLNQLTIQNFRGLRSLSFEGLRRVNLLVGRNNCGKSSVLEAIQMLASVGEPSALFQTAERRGERVMLDGSQRRRRLFDVSHFFYGHHVEEESLFEVIADNGRQFAAIVVPSESSDDSTGTGYSADDEMINEEEYGLTLQLSWFESGVLTDTVEIPLLTSGRIAFEGPFRRRMFETPVQMITTSSLTPIELTDLYDRIILTSEEEKVVESLRNIDPEIERVAPRQNGMFVKCSGIIEPIPLGTMGDGIGRMLGLALALARAENGILLVDEIDTGLHYTVMNDMWRMIIETAQRLNVQVFATSHSRDCYESLSEVTRKAGEFANLSIQRIEPNGTHAVAFTESQVVTAGERNLEVR